jgi:hypothetical protein
MEPVSPVSDVATGWTFDVISLKCTSKHFFVMYEEKKDFQDGSSVMVFEY